MTTSQQAWKPKTVVLYSMLLGLIGDGFARPITWKQGTTADRMAVPRGKVDLYKAAVFGMLLQFSTSQ